MNKFTIFKFVLFIFFITIIINNSSKIVMAKDFNVIRNQSYYDRIKIDFDCENLKSIIKKENTNIDYKLSCKNKIINLTFDTKNIENGIYEDKIFIYNNDDNEFVKVGKVIDININVTGKEIKEIKLKKASIKNCEMFSKCYLNINVDNLGNVNTKINITFENTTKSKNVKVGKNQIIKVLIESHNKGKFSKKVKTNYGDLIVDYEVFEKNHFEKKLEINKLEYINDNRDIIKLKTTNIGKGIVELKGNCEIFNINKDKIEYIKTIPLDKIYLNEKESFEYSKDVKIKNSRYKIKCNVNYNGFIKTKEINFVKENELISKEFINMNFNKLILAILGILLALKLIFNINIRTIINNKLNNIKRDSNSNINLKKIQEIILNEVKEDI